MAGLAEGTVVVLRATDGSTATVGRIRTIQDWGGHRPVLWRDHDDAYAARSATSGLPVARAVISTLRAAGIRELYVPHGPTEGTSFQTFYSLMALATRAQHPTWGEFYQLPYWLWGWASCAWTTACAPLPCSDEPTTLIDAVPKTANQKPLF